MRTVSLLTVLATVATLPLAAQQPDSSSTGSMRGQMHGQMGPGQMMQGGMMGQGMMGGGMMMNGGMMAGWMRYGMGMDSSTMGSMMRTMAFMPQHLLAERSSLKLTPAQVTRLESIQQSMQAAHRAMWSQAQPHMRNLASMMGGSSADSAALKRDFDAAQSAMSAAHWAVVNAVLDARAVLTPAQRRQVETSASAWSSRMMQGGGMGMQGH
jgi:Spy/CpxP family protein refolding chaperone